MPTIAWYLPVGSRRFHAFQSGQSRALCGRWAFFGDFSQLDVETGTRMKDECAGCVKKLPRPSSPEGV